MIHPTGFHANHEGAWVSPKQKSLTEFKTLVCLVLKEGVSFEEIYPQVPSWLFWSFSPTVEHMLWPGSF